MKRTIYAAGVNSRRRAAEAATCRFWLLSVTLLGGRVPDWLWPYLPGRQLLWDPGTFSEGAICYRDYRHFLERHRQFCSPYLQYDEPGDPEATAWYLQDMRRRGFDPIPVLQPGAGRRLLREPVVAVGGLVPIPPAARLTYLDALFYPDGEPVVVGYVHLLGMRQEVWFRRYPARSGDSTTWIPRAPWNRRKPVEEWLARFGEQEIPFTGPQAVQLALGVEA